MSVAGVAFAVLLVLVVTGLYRGWGASSEFFHDLPGDLWIAQEGTSDPLRSSSYLPAGAEAELQEVPGVLAAIPVQSRLVTVMSGGTESSAHVMSFEVPAALPMAAGDRERFVPDPGSVVIDRLLADAGHLDVGDDFEVLGGSLTVARIVPGGNPLFTLVFANATDADRLLGLDGYVAFYVLALDPGADPAEVAIAAAPVVPRSEIRTSDQYAATMAATVDEGFLPVVGALVGIGFAIGGAVVALTTYTATIEKARDFAVMKALGASAWFVYRVVIRQSAVIGMTGGVLGLLGAMFVAGFVRRIVPEFLTEIVWTDAVVVLAVTVLVSLAAAYVPVRRIERIDPAMVFRA